MFTDPHALKIFVDGSSYKNPGGLSGCAAVASFPDQWQRDPEIILDHGVAESTISRMELTACNLAIEWVCENAPTLSVTRVQIITDSKYVYDSIGRVVYWRNNGWRNLDGRPIENRDLWKRFISLRAKLRICTTFHWTKGKKSPLLKQVDKAAKSAAQSGQLGIDRGFKAGKVGRVRGITSGSATLFPASGQTAIIAPYRSGTVRKSENKIRFTLFSEREQEFAEKFYAYAEPEIGNQLHRGHIYRVRFGNKIRYPIIAEVIEEVTSP
jgi:ribonuclease HI